MAKLRVSKKVWTILGVAVLLLAAVGIGILTQLLQHKDTPADSGIKKLPSSIGKAEQLYGSGKTQEAEKQLQDALNDPNTSTEDKYLLYSSQAAIASDKQDYKTAIAALLKADEIKQTADTASALGGMYQQIGDKAKSIEYYKKAIERNNIDQTNPMRERQNEVYAEMIRNLGGQPWSAYY